MALMTTPSIQGETVRFGSGDGAFHMEFVKIGDGGNPPDTRTSPPMGAVDYEYLMAKYEASCFMTRSAVRVGAFDASVQNNCSRGENLPAHQEWINVARFANWLNKSSGYPPAYRLVHLGPDKYRPRRIVLRHWQPGDAGYDPGNPTRNSLAKFALPTLHEWHKAAYYDPSTGSYNLWATGNVEPARIGPEGGTAPNTAVYLQEVANAFLAEVTQAGGLSAYGTMGQSGNHGEWEEGTFFLDSLLGTRARRVGAEDARRTSQLTATVSRQRDLTGIWGFRVVALSQPDPLPGDTNSDGLVDLDDFLQLSEHFGEPGTYADGDFTRDGYVRFDDFLILSHNFGATREPQVVAVPEPGSLSLLSLAVLCLVGTLRHRRGKELEQPFFALTTVCTLLLAVSGTCHGQALDLKHRPGVGFFGTGIDGDSFLRVDPTEGGAVVTVFQKSGGDGPPLYTASWQADGWTILSIHELTTTGDGRRIVDDTFNPFGDVGGDDLTEGFERILPSKDGRYGLSLWAEPSQVFCRDEDGEFGHTCTGEYTMRYTVTAFPTPLGGDFNYDDAVDFADFTILSSNFSLHKPGFSWKDGDATLDGVVDFADFLIVSHNFGATREPQFVTVPEPGCLTLFGFAFGLLWIARRRRRKGSGKR